MQCNWSSHCGSDLNMKVMHPAPKTSNWMILENDRWQTASLSNWDMQIQPDTKWCTQHNAHFVVIWTQFIVSMRSLPDSALKPLHSITCPTTTPTAQWAVYNFYYHLCAINFQLQKTLLVNNKNICMQTMCSKSSSTYSLSSISQTARNDSLRRQFFTCTRDVGFF